MAGSAHQRAPTTADRGGLPPAMGHGLSSHRGQLTSATVLTLLALGVASAGRGAFFHREQVLVGLLLAAAGAGLIWRGPLLRRLWSPLAAAAAAIAVWALARAGIAGSAESALGIAGLMVAVVVVVTVARLELPSLRTKAITSLLLVGVAVAASGWLGVVMRWEPFGLPSQGVWRAATTITYPNAAAAFLVVLAMVALGRIGSRSPMVDALIAMVLLLGAAATLSRAGAIAAFAGLVVLGRLLGPRALATAAVPPVVGVSIAFAGLMPSLVRSSSARPWLALAALLSGLAVTAALSRVRVGPKPRRVRPVVLVVALLAVLAVLAVLSVGNGIDAFSGRLVPANRIERWQVAVEMFGEEPLVGVGPGPLWLTWDENGRTAGAWFVHNEYLQVLVQLGLVGAALLGGLLATGIQSIRAGRSTTPPSLYAGVVAGLTALAVQSAFDFLWHVPAIPLLAAALVGFVAAVDNKEEQQHA